MRQHGIFIINWLLGQVVPVLLLPLQGPQLDLKEYKMKQILQKNVQADLYGLFQLIKHLLFHSCLPVQ